MDPAYWTDHRSLGQDPGSAGFSASTRLLRHLAGNRRTSVAQTGDSDDEEASQPMPEDSLNLLK